MTPSEQPPRGALLPHHLSMLRDESGLPESVIEERGYYSASAYGEVRRLGFSDRQCITPALIVPLWNVDGEPAGYQIRPDQPRQGSNGKAVKYETPKGSRVVLDVPPRCRSLLRDPGIPLYVTEGSKKADGLAGQDACAVSLSGVWNWRGTNELGGKMALADWELIPLNERLVRIAFDSDVSRKQHVAHAMVRLKSFLEHRGAVVEVLYLPDCPDGRKQGIDDFFAAGGTVSGLDRYATSTVRLPALEDEPGTRRRVLVTDRHLDELAQECWEILVAANQPQPFVFRRGGELVRVDGTANVPLIRAWSEDDVHFVLERLAHYEKLVKAGDGFEMRPARLPRDVGKDILVAWNKPVPRLKGIVTTPLLAADGSFSMEPGYNPNSELYYDPRGPAIPEVPECPNPSDVAHARELLDDWLCDFPFVDEASRANTIGMAVTYVSRELITGPTPLFVVTAPTQGTGKGLLVQTSGIVMLGAVPAVTTEPHDADEWRKRITAQLMEGAGIILLDNVKRRLASAELAAALTSEEWSDRVLGTNQTARVPNRAVWVATGNNVELDGEITRRSILIGLDAKRDRPWEGRVFRHENLLEWVTENRGELVWALLVLARHWIALGRPPCSGQLIGTYESWTRVIGGILECAGITGFLANREELYRKADEETEDWRDFVSAWAAKYGTASVKAAELADLVLEQDLMERMRAAITDDDVLKVLKIRLGKGLSKYADRRFGDWFIRQRGKDSHQKGRLYGLDLAEDAGLASQPSAHSPRPIGAIAASIAEGAEDDFFPGAQAHSQAEHSNGPRMRCSEGGTDHPPHAPHPPLADSDSDGSGAESPAEGSLLNNDPPRCRSCGVVMSVVRVGDLCGRCQRRDD